MKRDPSKPSKILPRPWARDDAPQTKPIEPQSTPKRGLSRSTSPVARSPMKKSRRKSSPATRSAKDQECLLKFPGCAGTDAALCHLRMFGAAGVGQKPLDFLGAYGCKACHDRLDGRVPWIKDADPDFNFYREVLRALAQTQTLMHAAGVLIMKGESP